jgi:hypothetical protein
MNLQMHLVLGLRKIAGNDSKMLISAEEAYTGIIRELASALQLLFGKFAKLIGNGAGRFQHD